MPTPPPGLADLAHRGVRGLAVGAVTLVVAAVTALAEGTDGASPGILGIAAALLLVAGGLRATQGRWRSASATSAVVAGAVLAGLAARSWLGITGEQLPAFLGIAGGVAVTAGVLTDERRLTALGIAQWALALALPVAGGTVFRHCLVATDLAIPVPRLDGPLLVAVAAVVVGTGMRWAGRRLQAARGIEVTGLVLLLGGLLAKGAELPGLPALCGAGGATDAGWLALALAAGAAAAWYGLATHDAVWAAAGAAGTALAGLVGTSLSGGAVWAAVALVPIGLAIAWCEVRGVPWPSRPGYGRRAPWEERGEDSRA